MASSEDIFPQTACCEICGIGLGDEVVIQEFADGSLVRLCTECAAGANLDDGALNGRRDADIAWPEAPPEAPASSGDDNDPLEKTRELLLPVVDLIALQGEMQAALERLASSLERFAVEMITESQDKSAVESRLQVLEQELDDTRKQLSEAESALNTASASLDGLPNASVQETPALAPVELVAPIAEAPTKPPGLVAPPGPANDTAGAESVAPAAPAAAPEPKDLASFRIEEVQATQRYFNESHFIDRIRDVRRSLGKPKANVSRFAGPDPLAIVTVTWDIVWYQYLVDLRRDFSTSAERVSLFREGMDLDEIAYDFREKNAVINDDGRLDASELEVKLLSDPSALITELTPEEARLLDDATEEVWDQKISPEFKWDD